jgi:hypothetical protein
MFYRYGVLLVVLAVSSGSLRADDKKEEKKAPEAKGKIVKYDAAKKSLTLKTDDGEKDYSVAEVTAVQMPGGGKMAIKPRPKGAPAESTEPLAFALRVGNEVTLVLAGEKETAVKEIHVTRMAGSGQQRGPKVVTEEKKEEKKDDKKK